MFEHMDVEKQPCEFYEDCECMIELPECSCKH